MKRAEKDGHLLTKEAHRAANQLRIDFEKGGIHLPPDHEHINFALQRS